MSPSGSDDGSYSDEAVQALTDRAAELLDQLRDVLGEMTNRLEALSEGEDS
jgi:hypothetical protein